MSVKSGSVYSYGNRVDRSKRRHCIVLTDPEARAEAIWGGNGKNSCSSVKIPHCSDKEA